MSPAVLRILLFIGWAIAQPLALLIGGWGLLGASYGRPGTSLFGLFLILLPAILLLAGLTGARRHPEQAGLWLALPLIGMVSAVGLALLLVGNARG